MADEKTPCRELDEQFAPYVDGEAPPASRRAVEAHLAACPPCLDRADDERSARDALVEHRAELRAAAPPALRARCLALQSSSFTTASQASRRATLLRRWAPLSVAATLVLAIAGVFVFGLNDRVEALAASLAIDHVKCFKVEGAAAHADALVAARDWQQDQGWPIVVPQSEPAQQLTLLDVRRCFTSDGRSAHMMYTWRGGPLSLYVLPEDIGRDQVVDKMGHEAVIWCANRRTYAVVADGHPQDLSRVIDYMKAHVR
jgi:anti-sigma factor (TIGR02949 family)